jgi:methanogenic corrinoid protein MtbC1
MSERELDLSTISDDELVEQIHDDLYDGLAEEIDEGTRISLGRDWSPANVLDKAVG